MLLSVVGESGSQACPDGNQARLEEFRVPDGKHLLLEVDVATAQPQCFPGPKSCSVEQENDGPDSLGLQQPAIALLLTDGLQQPSKFLVRVDVRTESALDAWGRFLEGGVNQEPSGDEVAEEAAQRSMFPFPEAGGKAFAAAKRPAVLGCDGFEVDVPEGTAKERKIRVSTEKTAPRERFKVT